jgi:hypothetical protein
LRPRWATLGQAAQYHTHRDLNPGFNLLASHHAVFFRNHCSALGRFGNGGKSSACVRSVAKANRTSASVALRSARLDRQRPHGALEIVIHSSEDLGHDLPIEPPFRGVDQRLSNNATSFSSSSDEGEATRTGRDGASAKRTEDPTRTSLHELSAIEGELAAIELPKEMMAVVEERADGFDVVGIEKWRLEYLVRFVLWWKEKPCPLVTA